MNHPSARPTPGKARRSARAVPARRQAAAAPLPAVSSPPAHMLSIVNATARSRWMGQTLRTYTPSYVETIARAAMAGQLEAQWQMFDLMEQTWPVLAKCLGELKDGVVGLDWEVCPWSEKGATPTESAQRKAALVEHALWSMRPDPAADENDFEDTVRHACDAIGKGISLQEIDWETRPFAGSSLILPRCTRWVHPRYYGYPTEGRDRLMLDTAALAADRGGPAESGMRNAGNFTPRPSLLLPQQSGRYAPLPDNKFILSVMKMKTGHPISGAMLRVLGFYWAAQNFTWEWFLNYAQIFGMPVRLAFYDQSATAGDIAEINDMLENMGTAAYGSFPAGTDIKYLTDGKSSTGAVHDVLIQKADEVCTLVCLRQTLTSTQGTSGSQALGTVHQGGLHDRISALAREAAKAINHQLIRPLIALNFGNTDELPVVEPGRKAVEDPLLKAQRITTYLGISGFKVGRAWLHEASGIPQPGEGDDVIEGSAPPSPFGGFGGGPQSGRPSAPPAREDEEEGNAPDGEESMRARRPARRLARVQAKDATEKVVDVALEKIAGVEAQWLGGLRAPFYDLMAMATSARASDADFLAAAERFAQEMPNLFSKIKHEKLADLIEGALGAAVVNGAVQGFTDRRNAS